MARTRLGARQVWKWSPLFGTVLGYFLRGLGKRWREIGSKGSVGNSEDFIGVLIRLRTVRVLENRGYEKVRGFDFTALSGQQRVKHCRQGAMTGWEDLVGRTGGFPTTFSTQDSPVGYVRHRSERSQCSIRSSQSAMKRLACGGSLGKVL